MWCHRKGTSWWGQLYIYYICSPGALLWTRYRYSAAPPSLSIPSVSIWKVSKEPMADTDHKIPSSGRSTQTQSRVQKLILLARLKPILKSNQSQRWNWGICSQTALWLQTKMQKFHSLHRRPCQLNEKKMKYNMKVPLPESLLALSLHFQRALVFLAVNKHNTQMLKATCNGPGQSLYLQTELPQGLLPQPVGVWHSSVPSSPGHRADIPSLSSLRWREEPQLSALWITDYT